MTLPALPHPLLRAAVCRQFCLLSVVALLGSCGWVQGRITSRLMTDVAAATARHDDVVLVRQAIPPLLLLLDGLLQGSPEDEDLLRAGAETYTSYASLVELNDPERARRLYARARDYGRRALVARRAETGPLLDRPYTEFTAITDHLRPQDVETVFWAASSWGAWISTHLDSMAALADLPRVIFLMEWVLARDETFLHGAPHVFLGIYHAALPPALGGSPVRSRAHFERALQINQRQALIVQVQMARYYARQIFDRELYVALLQEVLASPADVIPELRLQNMTAKGQARALLEQTDDLF